VCVGRGRPKCKHELFQDCVRYPSTPVNTVIYGDTRMHIVVAEVVDGERAGAAVQETIVQVEAIVESSIYACGSSIPRIGPIRNLFI
jgi:hypothetical protein